MAVFQAALLNEIEKLYRKKKVLVAILLSLAVIVIGQLVIVGVRSGFGLRGTGSVEFPMLVLSVVVNTILPLFTALVTIDSFSGEFSQNSMRITLTRPISRFKIYTAKITSIVLFILGALLLLLVFSMLAGFIFNANSASFDSLGRTVFSYLVSILPMTVLALGIVLLANIFRSGIAVFFISILIFLAFKVLGLLFSQYSSLFLTTQLDWYNLFLVNSFPLAKIARQFLIMLGSGIMLFSAGFYIFDKKEF
ncbi:membrane protein [Desulfosporosinus sp. HMP52]|uniref:ABC-2 type transport system permease protein n=1 Tax=Desulfosporosinus hippei DSM 8344 TaxID=1121419 RepID=A0A1G8EMJ6_9FIRM|nr:MULTISPECIES: ABC transporter permease [Desulfosporosinus]KGK90008.1 membrane protein [Desulfosporosinus sp. HMP52]SDH71123.1 ABC-2 type transport system permease protein [Desulfosporosinus hippei DSM 8344]